MTNRRRGYMKWSQESEDLLVRMYEAGCTISEMAEVIKRPVHHLRTRLNYLGLLLSERGHEIQPDMDAFSRIMQLRQGEGNDT
jgi:hypothetical protein